MIIYGFIYIFIMPGEKHIDKAAANVLFGSRTTYWFIRFSNWPDSFYTKVYPATLPFQPDQMESHKTHVWPHISCISCNLKRANGWFKSVQNSIQSDGRGREGRGCFPPVQRQMEEGEGEVMGGEGGSYQHPPGRSDQTTLLINPTPPYFAHLTICQVDLETGTTARLIPQPRHVNQRDTW